MTEHVIDLVIDERNGDNRIETRGQVARLDAVVALLSSNDRLECSYERHLA